MPAQDIARRRIISINVTFFTVYRFFSLHSHVNTTYTGYPIAKFSLLLQGTGRFCFGSNEVTIVPGDLIYIPPFVPYTSYWSSIPSVSDEIEFYVIEFDIAKFNPAGYDLQKIEKFRDRNIFDKLYKVSGESRDFASTGIFYDIFQTMADRLIPTKNKDLFKIQPALDYIEENLTRDFSVQDLARECSFSESHFYTLFKNLMGCSPIEYKNTLRTQQAAIYLRHGYTIEKICEMLNFSSCSHLRSTIKKYTGQNPSDLKDVKI